MTKKGLEVIQEFEDQVGLIARQRKDDDSHSVASYIFVDAARELEGWIPKFNKIKKQLDKAHEANDVDAFTQAHIELKELLYDVNFSNLTARVNRRKKWLKVVTPLRNELRNKFAFIKSARDNGAKWRKRMAMSPKQRKAADNTSMRMRQSWGM